MGRPRTGTAIFYRGAWHAVVSLRSEMVDGKTKRKRRKVRIPDRADGRPITEAYAREFAERAQHGCDDGTIDFDAPTRAVAPSRVPTVIEFLRAWIKTQKHDSASREAERIEFYFPEDPIANMPLDVVRPRHIVEFIERLKARPSRREGTLAPRTIRNVYSLLQRMFGHAELVELAEVSPCARTSRALPAIKDKNPGERAGMTFTVTEVEQLISDPRVPFDRRTLYSLLFLTGARYGEATALKWSDYDRDRQPLGCITVSRSIDSLSREEKDDTKTGVIKYVPVHPTLAGVLAEWKLSGFAEKLGRKPTDDDRLVPNKLGTPRGEHSDLQMLRIDCKRLGFRERHLHCTRHTFVSLSTDAGARREVMRWVTHAPPTDVRGSYTHPAWLTLCDEMRKLPIKRFRHRGLVPSLVPKRTG